MKTALTFLFVFSLLNPGFPRFAATNTTQFEHNFPGTDLTAEVSSTDEDNNCDTVPTACNS